ncbi:hypothetical protein PR202_gb14421 [Eleusine coracana subsp. coracana]|uniref:Uncharacterized protein n=1 Tax=Eleusine coracana subsp. coracana TaxID=191504 RepID=A0AAV5ESX8_ELECO|nr:hypothetical protein QOZ80_4BG0335260 [Eleusine coracana subsp. coracana]GJN26489.1 hypothetical protein PR202_gb14421 [Eleusine coracana subsp. coracana]
MAKSLRSKREKRLRTLRREIAEPFYDKKEAAKLAAQAAALEAPRVPVRAPPQSQDADSSRGRAGAPSSASAMDVEMSDGGNDRSKSFLKPIGSISKKKVQLHLKIKKDKRKARKKGRFSKKK